jgi:hypothetical protein
MRAARRFALLTRGFVVKRPSLKASEERADMRIFSTLDTVGGRG